VDRGISSHFALTRIYLLEVSEDRCSVTEPGADDAKSLGFVVGQN
jgi:hypothetical protein